MRHPAVLTRWLARIVLFAVMGVLLTFADAWFGWSVHSWLRTMQQASTIVRQDEVIWVVVRTKCHYWSSTNTWTYSSSERAERMLEDSRSVQKAFGFRSPLFDSPAELEAWVCPPWTTFRSVDPRPYALPEAGMYRCAVLDFAVGWPAYSLANSVVSHPDPAGQLTPEFRGHIALGPWNFPARPLWPGFAINTVFYGGLAAVLATAFRLARANWRRIRGNCTSCGYSRRGIPVQARCPECGHGA